MVVTVLTVLLQGHINLGKKGYRVPSKGTLQLTLFNPLGTVVKMFVVQYDLSDMPPSSQVSCPSLPFSCMTCNSPALHCPIPV